MVERLTLASAEQRDHHAAQLVAPVAANAPSNLEVIRRAMCLADGHDCDCRGRGECLGTALYGGQAAAVLEALRAAGRLAG